MYTLESLKPLNTAFDREHRLEQSDVELVNLCVKLIEGARGETPCPGDRIEYTDEYSEYSPNAHIEKFDQAKGRFVINARPYTPFVTLCDSGQEAGFFKTGGGPEACVDAAGLTYVGRREKRFAVFSRHCVLPRNSAVHFKALVNVWAYIAPDQKYPGYSTKDWVKMCISCVENPRGGGCHYWSQNVIFGTLAELQRWKNTYKAVEFPGDSPNQVIWFLYRETEKLVSREDWDALNLPLDTRWVNGNVHVKVKYDDKTHTITAYRFTNSGYLAPERFGTYERAKGTLLVAPGPEIRKESSK